MPFDYKKEYKEFCIEENERIWDLKIKTVHENMQDLSMFEDETFDCVIHPWSNGYVDDVLSVWKECARVLKRQGCLLAGLVIRSSIFLMPINYCRAF